MADLKLPADFKWGYATASYQVEGSPEADGRGPSIWDTFSRNPQNSEDGLSGDIATDSYKRWDEDIALMKEYGVNSYRMSLSWSRIIPLGGKDDPVNPAAIAHYRKVFQALKDSGITCFATLFHWDLPQALQDRYKGFLDQDKIVPDFERYARVCFENFGDLVTNWFTINEPNVYSVLGHVVGRHAPGRSSNRERNLEGDSMKEPYIVGHSLILSHATIVKLYRDEFKQKQGGTIGIVVNFNWGEPYDETPENKAAAIRLLEKFSLWFSDPIVFGDYGEAFKSYIGDRLPKFTEDQKALIKGSTDFLGINHYTTYLIKNRTTPADPNDIFAAFFGDLEMTFTGPDGKEIAPPAGLSWVRPVPWGFKKLLKFCYDRYKIDIYVTENGVVCPDEHTIPREEAMHDQFRIDFYEGYVNAMAEAINEGVPVKSYLAWSFLDNFEWQEGYTARFGVTYIDYEDNCKRYPKDSAAFMKKFMNDKILKE